MHHGSHNQSARLAGTYAAALADRLDELAGEPADTRENGWENILAPILTGLRTNLTAALGNPDGYPRLVVSGLERLATITIELVSRWNWGDVVTLAPDELRQRLAEADAEHARPVQSAALALVLAGVANRGQRIIASKAPEGIEPHPDPEAAAREWKTLNAAWGRLARLAAQLPNATLEDADAVRYAAQMVMDGLPEEPAKAVELTLNQVEPFDWIEARSDRQILVYLGYGPNSDSALKRLRERGDVISESIGDRRLRFRCRDAAIHAKAKAEAERLSKL